MISKLKTLTMTLMMGFMFPTRCICCQSLLTDMEADCCDLCYNKLKIIESDYCGRCGKRHETKGDICFDCRKAQHVFTAGRGVFVYEELIKSSIFGLKFFNKTWIGQRFGKILAEYYLNNNLWEVDGIIPVPLHTVRFIERGFNQAEIIASSFSKVVKIPIHKDVLIRFKKTKPQKDLTDNERMHNLKLAFSVKNKEVIQGKRILLVDDIYTTGSTIDSCAKVLLEYGAIEVYFLTVAIGDGY